MKKFYNAFTKIYIINFSIYDNRLNNKKLVTESKITITGKSTFVCLEGTPTVNGKELVKYDYINPDNGDYTIDLKTDGVLLLFTKT